MINKDQYQEIVDNLPIGHLINTQKSPFWYKKIGEDKFAERYEHEKGKKGDIFYDGNNGDRWEVLAINTQWRRIIVQNLSQHGIHLVYWN